MTKKVGLVLEGGAMRGMFTAGVLDTFMDEDIKIDCIMGVSAGALFGVNYYSKQKGRVIRYSKKYCKNPRYMGLLSLLFTGNIVNKNFAYYDVTNKLDVFNEAEYVKNNTGYYIVVTNMETGKAEYIELNSCVNNLEYLRATSSMPLVSKNVKINDKLYLDGAIADSIPVQKLKELGYDKIIVVLTRPIDYRKEPFHQSILKYINRKYKKYPKFIEALENRYNMYNNTIKDIMEMEKNNEIFVIRPTTNINVKHIEKNKNKLQETYDLGISCTKEKLSELKKYLKQ